MAKARTRLQAIRAFGALLRSPLMMGPSEAVVELFVRKNKIAPNLHLVIHFVMSGRSFRAVLYAEITASKESDMVLMNRLPGLSYG